MSIVAKHLSHIKASPSTSLSNLAFELESQGRDIIRMSAGEPDFNTPDHVKQAGIDAITRNDTKYPHLNGIMELREAICSKLKRENNLDYNSDQILVTNGGKQAIYNALVASLDPGDEVIIPSPYWVSYPDMVLLNGGKPVIAETTAKDDFKLTAETLEAAITAKTKWVILNNPNNPSGAVMEAEDLQALAEVLRAHPQIWVLTDDIYEHILYDGVTFSTIAEVAPDLHSRTLTMNGFSKAYCMTGWRLGYAAAPKELISAMSKIQSQSTSGVSTISQWAGVAALQGDQSFIGKNNARFLERRDLALSIINQCQGLQCDAPKGAFYLYIDCKELIGRKTPQGKTIESDADFSTYLLDTQGVAAVHGAAFGLSPFFRISYATDDATIEAACIRIQSACGDLR